MNKSETNSLQPIEKVLKNVLAKVAKVCPDGVGLRDGSWDHTEEAHDVFMAALTEWDAGEDTPEARRKVQKASDKFVEAWRKAAEEAYYDIPEPTVPLKPDVLKQETLFEIQT